MADSPQADTPSPARRKPRSTPRGRTLDPAALAEVQALLGDAPLRRDLLIEYLHRLQDTHGCLYARHLVALASGLQLAPAEVYEVATFYHHFDVVKENDAPPPALTVRVCDSISCELAGARDLLTEISATVSGRVRVLAAPCVGRCEQAPVAVVGQNPVGRATAESVARAINANAIECPIDSYIDYHAYRANGGYRVLNDCLRGARDPESVMTTLEQAGLRGLGGAGFPAGRKWRLVRAQPGLRLLAVNIDEGEPGTFKDRWYLERDPHRFLEGALIAAWAVGIDEIYLYIRDEYAGGRVILRTELDRLRGQWPDGLPPIHLRRGAGAYVCGEESAMIESIEGKRGMPRLRPPYLAQVGLFGRPTLEHNMETLHWVREILERGPDHFIAHGRRGRTGLRSFSLSGRIVKPGVYVAPAGISARELIDEYGGGMSPGHTFYAYLPGGASGGILPAALGDLPLDFGTLEEHGCFIGSAAVIVLSDRDRTVDVARNAMRFFREESCGKCTPCRVGTSKAVTLMEQPVWKRALLEELMQTMADASICGLGQAAPNPVRCVLRYFSHELT